MSRKRKVYFKDVAAGEFLRYVYKEDGWGDAVPVVPDDATKLYVCIRKHNSLLPFGEKYKTVFPDCDYFMKASEVELAVTEAKFEDRFKYSFVKSKDGKVVPPEACKEVKPQWGVFITWYNQAIDALETEVKEPLVSSNPFGRYEGKDRNIAIFSPDSAVIAQVENLLQGGTKYKGSGIVICRDQAEFDKNAKMFYSTPSSSNLFAILDDHAEKLQEIRADADYVKAQIQVLKLVQNAKFMNPIASFITPAKAAMFSGKTRSEAQSSVMGEQRASVSPNVLALALGASKDNKFEWLHKIAHSFGYIGAKENAALTPQVPGNLVLGTWQANSQMLVWESHLHRLLDLKKYYIHLTVAITPQFKDVDAAWLLEYAKLNLTYSYIIHQIDNNAPVFSFELKTNVWSLRRPTWAEAEIDRFLFYLEQGWDVTPFLAKVDTMVPEVPDDVDMGEPKPAKPTTVGNWGGDMEEES